MKRAVQSVRQGIAVTEAFKSSLNEKSQGDDSCRERDGPLGDRLTLNLGGLEIPYSEGELNRYEKLFLRSAEYGDVKTAQKIIDNAKQLNVNVNCVDAMDRGALRLAIEAEQIELLQMLLTYETIELKDSLLHAISEENVQAVELILQAQSERHQRKNLKVSYHVWRICEG